jgi:hypothetical protein
MKKTIFFGLAFILYASLGLSQANDKSFGFVFTQDSVTKQYKITGIIKGGPAEKAKLLKGDVLLMINNIDFKNLDFPEVSKIIKEAKDESSIGILRNKKEQAINITKTDRISIYNNAATYHTYTLKNGDKYEGFAVDENLLHGKGKYTARNGEIYEGNFVINLLEGKGKITYTDGAVYEGDLKSTSLEGQGKITLKDGSIYTGEFKDGYKNGKGKMIYVNGGVYDGNWKAGVRDGDGKLTYKNGDEYDGKWGNDKEEGKGVYKHESNGDLTIIIGTWINGKQEGEFARFANRGATTWNDKVFYKNGQQIETGASTSASTYNSNATTTVNTNTNQQKKAATKTPTFRLVTTKKKCEVCNGAGYIIYNVSVGNSQDVYKNGNYIHGPASKAKDYMYLYSNGKCRGCAGNRTITVTEKVYSEN